eukprot:gene35349-4041_t
MPRDNRYYSGAGAAAGVSVSFFFLFGDCGAAGAEPPGHPLTPERANAT